MARGLYPSSISGGKVRQVVSVFIGPDYFGLPTGTTCDCGKPNGIDKELRDRCTLLTSVLELVLYLPEIPPVFLVIAPVPIANVRRIYEEPPRCCDPRPRVNQALLKSW